jgi:hypothetical protein
VAATLDSTLRHSCVAGRRWFRGVQRAGGGGEQRVGRMSCAVRGSPCDVRANAGAADRHRAQQQGLAGVGIAMWWAADRTVRWAVVGVLDGLEFQEREGGQESSLSGLVPLPRADWTD